jgi:hypothetical protein
MSETLQLTIQDLALMKDFISVACERGAFKANEMSAVGQTYDKLATFLNAAIAQAEAQAAETQQQGEANA